MDFATMHRLLTASLSALLVLPCFAVVRAAEGPTSVTLAQALHTDPPDLARGYLVVNSQLLAAQVAGMGVTVHTTVDGKAQTIDKSNYQTFVSGYEERLRIYSQAISQRGFAQIGGDYEMSVSAGCKQLGLKDGTAVIKQDGFQFQWETGQYQGKLGFSGVVVESAVAVKSEIYSNFEVKGKVLQHVIELRFMPSNGVTIGDLHLSGPRRPRSHEATLGELVALDGR